MAVQTIVRRTLAGLVMITGSVALLTLAAITDGWSGVAVSSDLLPWLVTSPLPALWTAAIVLWTLVLVAVLVSDDRSPRLGTETPMLERWTALDDHIYQDDRAFIRLGRSRPEPILRVSGRRQRSSERNFVA